MSKLPAMPELRTAIVGSRHHDGAVERLKDLHVGAPIVLVRDHRNCADPNAVACHAQDGLRLGYVPRADASRLAPLMDSGQVLQATLVTEAIIDLGGVRFGPRIRIEV